MKLLICLLVVVPLVGCGVELLTTTAIQGELQAQQLTAMEGQVSRTADTSAKINIKRAIDTYQAEQGKYPSSLDELVPNYLPSLPIQPNGTSYAYDAATGKLVEGEGVLRPNAILPGPTAGDRQKMKQLMQAIDKYGKATGYYPTSLSALVPTYISAIPKTDSGEEFIFKPETGELRHPLQPENSVPAAGAGLTGEAMTGIAMQNQLDSNSNAGVSGVAGHARGNAGRAVQQQQQQQEQALQQLGY